MNVGNCFKCKRYAILYPVKRNSDGETVFICLDCGSDILKIQ